MFGTEGGNVNSRQLAGIYLKNLISAQDPTILEQKIDKWRSCDEANKTEIRNWFLVALASPEPVVGHTAAQIIGAFGAVDVPTHWPALVPTLLRSVLDAGTPALMKKSSLEVSRFSVCCENLRPSLTC
jgi:hypothetical protein